MGKDAPADTLIPGTLDMLVLKAISREDAMHGYAVAQTIRVLSQDVLQVEEGALYQALHRLEVRGMLRSRWGTSDSNRRAKFYTITASGRRQLDQQARSWVRMSAAIAGVMERG